MPQPPNPDQATNASIVYLFLAIALCLVVLAEDAAASGDGHGSDNVSCQEFAVSKVIGVTEAGVIRACIEYPAVVPLGNSTFHVATFLEGPAVTGGATVTYTATAISGCIQGAIPVPQGSAAASVGFQRSYYQAVTMAGRSCDLKVALDVTGSSGTLFQHTFAVLVTTPLPDSGIDQLSMLILVGGCWLVLVLVSRFVKPAYVRSAIMVPGFVVITWATSAELFVALMAVQTAILVYDVWQVVEGE